MSILKDSWKRHQFIFPSSFLVHNSARIVNFLNIGIQRENVKFDINLQNYGCSKNCNDNGCRMDGGTIGSAVRQGRIKICGLTSFKNYWTTFHLENITGGNQEV